jgi:hypothetical protein
MQKLRKMKGKQKIRALKRKKKEKPRKGKKKKIALCKYSRKRKKRLVR